MGREQGDTMQNLKEYVEYAKESQKKRLLEISVQMKSLPPGELLFARKHQKYYCVQKIGETRCGISKEPELVRELALKRYLRAEREALQGNLQLLEKVLESCQDTTFDAIMQKLPPGFRQLPNEYYRQKA